MLPNESLTIFSVCHAGFFYVTGELRPHAPHPMHALRLYRHEHDAIPDQIIHFLITGHNISQALIDRNFEVNKRYFNMPAEEKANLPQVRAAASGFAACSHPCIRTWRGAHMCQLCCAGRLGKAGACHSPFPCFLHVPVSSLQAC